MNKKELKETEICMRCITPAIERAGWDVQRQVRREFSFADRRIIVRGNMVARGKRKRADYLLYRMKSLPIAVVEAKDNKHRVGDGMQQALAYAEALDLPFAFSSNGDGFLFHDRTAAAEQSRFTQARGARTRRIGAGSGIGAWHR